MRTLSGILAALVSCVACSQRPENPPPPTAEFLLAAGDSAFWVISNSSGFTVRAAPLELASVRDRLFEVYVADDDQSFSGADLIGQKVFRRDIRTGDSLLVYADTMVPALAREYARAHPGDHRLAPDEESGDEPSLRATSTLDLGATHGDYISYELHTDIERNGAPLWHTSRHGVIDLRNGRAASLRDVIGEAASDVERRRDAELKATLDTVRASHDARGLRASLALSHYRVDPTSFSITTVDGAPAIEYALPGAGAGDEGHVLELPPIPVRAPAWWNDVAGTLPTNSSDGSRAVWKHGPYSVVVRYEASGDARLSLRDSTSREWYIGAVSAPAKHIVWLDYKRFDSPARDALMRAFSEAAAYGGDGAIAIRGKPHWLLARHYAR